jgi:hypothetical protein
MGLIERLEKRARELDAKLSRMLVQGDYAQWLADDRELLLEAAMSLRLPRIKITRRKQQPFRFDPDD